MPTYAYSAISRDGVQTKGQIAAASEIAALDDLAGKGLTPIDLAEAKTSVPWWNRDISFGTTDGFKPEELEAFFAGLSAMLAAKAPLPRALVFCADLSKDKSMQAKLKSAIANVEDGATLADALAADGIAFPDRLTALVRLGERTNTLSMVVDRIAGMLRAEALLRRQVQQALIYPGILSLMSVFVISVLVFYLAPTLAPVFASASTPPPTMIAAMLWLQETLTRDWAIVPVALAAASILGFALRNAFSASFGRLISWLPAIRRYQFRKESLQLCQTFLLVLGSGGRLSEALRIAGQTTRNTGWRNLLETALQEIEAGATLEASLLQSSLIDPMVRTILKTGEESDQLVTVLPATIDALQAQTSETLSQAIRMLTPILTLVIGITIGAIILSTISAIMDLNDVVL